MTTTTELNAIQPYATAVLTGTSSAVTRLRLQLARIAPHYRVALITGEAGTGKHAMARYMHNASPVAQRQFLCLPADEFAQKEMSPTSLGTVYLPGLEALPAEAQTRLLRALGKLPRETRVVTASQCDLRGMLSTGRLRQDLFERIGPLQIQLAPLRERVDDIEEIAYRMLRQRHTPGILSEAARLQLRNHAWPGNLRELFDLCEGMAASDGMIDALPLAHEEFVPVPSPTAKLETVMHRHVLDVLERCAGNKMRAAEVLGISRSTLYRMLGTQSEAILVR